MGTLTLKTDGGFTFLEVMIAFSFVAIVMVTLFQLHTQSLALGVRARFNSVAPMLAEQKMTELLSDPESLLPSDDGDFDEEFPGYTWQSEYSDTESEYLDDTTKRLKKIDLYVEAEDTSLFYHLRTYHLFDKEP